MVGRAYRPGRHVLSWKGRLGKGASIMPRLMGYVVVAIELIGGLCILAGLLTRIWSALLAMQMLLIPFVVKSQVGLVAPSGSPGTGFELDLVIAACAIALVLMGPGALALDGLLGVEGAAVTRS